MLFYPSADEKLAAIASQLELWDAEADRVRAAAVAARAGEAPSAALVADAEDAHEALTALIDELDRALATRPAGSAGFTRLLRAQTRAVALIESVATSLDILAECPAVPVSGPILLGHAALLRAAE